MNRSTPWLFLALVCLMSGTSSLVASKVIYLKPLDEGFIEIYLKEGGNVVSGRRQGAQRI